MENPQKQPEKAEAIQEEHQLKPENAESISIIRSNTPRPLKVGPGFIVSEQRLPAGLPLSSLFPASAPGAPPLPEEMASPDEQAPLNPQSAPGAHEQTAPVMEDNQEFVWLFEYALEMDATMLNSPEGLNGQALLYGPAVLKGYHILFGMTPGEGNSGEGNGRTIATVVPGSGRESEVWGVLYRVPRSLTLRSGSAPSLLDTAHGAVPPHQLFHPVKATVHESYRGRDVACIVYIATERVRQQLRVFSPLSHPVGAAFVQRVAAIAQRQKLPEAYLNTYLLPLAVPASMPERPSERSFLSVPLPVTKLNSQAVPSPVTSPGPYSYSSASVPPSSQAGIPRPPQLASWFVGFAWYLSALFLGVLFCAFCRGFSPGSASLVDNVTLLGVPWLVFVYGLLGGCISCLISLGRLSQRSMALLTMRQDSMVVIIIWFARPFIGGVLGLLVYLFLDSGLFQFEGVLTTHPDIAFLCAALAGLCEFKLFHTRHLR